VTLIREGSCEGQGSCKVTSFENGKAQVGIDYAPLKNQVVMFADNQQAAELRIELPDSSIKDMDQNIPEVFDPLMFTLELSEPEDVRLSRRTTCTVEIHPIQENIQKLRERRRLLNYLMKHKEPSYLDQMKLSMVIGPQVDENNIIEEVTEWEAAVHFISMPWKVLFSVIPPRSYFGGWIAFATALVLIGVMTYVIGHLAETIGCLINLKSSVTGLILIAVGTSMSEVFSSRNAARCDNSAFADNSIAHIAAANAATVFVGLGLPWTIATTYHWAKHDESFFIGKFETADITFAVVLLLACCIITLMVLGLRRSIIGGELGGPSVSRMFSAGLMIVLWLIFIFLNNLN
jgi:Ca2+/Na+ antiporter